METLPQKCGSERDEGRILATIGGKNSKTLPLIREISASKREKLAEKTRKKNKSQGSRADKMESVHEAGNAEIMSKKVAQKRNPYTLFVGNIPYKATKEEIKKHFEKAGEVIDVRIPTHKVTEIGKGFAYVEVKDRSSYEKALALHHTRILGRAINVEYTTQGKKGGPKEEKIKQKNLKLRALSKIGVLLPIDQKKKKKKVSSAAEFTMEGSESK